MKIALTNRLALNALTLLGVSRVLIKLPIIAMLP